MIKKIWDKDRKMLVDIDIENLKYKKDKLNNKENIKEEISEDNEKEYDENSNFGIEEQKNIEKEKVIKAKKKMTPEELKEFRRNLINKSREKAQAGLKVYREKVKAVKEARKKLKSEMSN
jgi:hypothetical protein